MSIYKLICIPRRNSSRELEEINTVVDMFVNPSYGDNYPTVNLEAKSCGHLWLHIRMGVAPEIIHGDGIDYD